MITLDLLDSSFHSVEIQTAAGQALAIDGSGFLTTNVNGTVTVSATDLDIRGLNVATDGDHLYITDSTGANNLAVDASGFLTVNASGGSFAVTATDLDIRDLDATQDNVAISDGTDTLAINADGSINALFTEAGYSSWLVSTETVGTTEGELVSTPLSGRLSVLIQNTSNNDIYLRDQTGVTTANGLRLPKGSSYEANLNSTSNIFAIAGSGSNDIIVVEYAS